MKKLYFIYFDAGGGHRAAATALKSVIEDQQRPWEIHLMNLQEVLSPLDIVRKLTGINLQDMYNLLLAKGWTLGLDIALKFTHGLIRTYERPARNLLARYWSDSRPDMVVSLVPNFNRPLYESLRIWSAEVPYVTILTDLADYPPHFWIEPGQDQFFVCGTEKAVEQARAAGYKGDRVFATSGMILRPSFYNDLQLDRAAERAKLGLDPSKPAGVVLFGGAGSNVMIEIAERLSDRQLILICGHNEKLAKKLSKRGSKSPHFVEGFTQDVPKYMYLADYFIGKPGPGSISEAIAMKLPVIVERNAWTMPQERYNTDWVLEKGVGLVLRNFREVAAGVDRLLGALDEYRTRVEKIQNRAVFEIPDMFEKILKSAGG